jgi:hypothetical protein
MGHVSQDGRTWTDANGLPLVPQTPANASVGVASGSILAANVFRRGLILVNISSNRISIGFGQAAVLDSGVTLMPGGGVYNMGELDFFLGEIFAIASGAGSTLTIQHYL